MSGNTVSTRLELIDQAVVRAQELKESIGKTAGQNRDLAMAQEAVEVVPSPSELMELDAPPLVDERPAPARTRKRADERTPIAAPQLELAIVEAVKNAEPTCQAFVGVIVQRTNPKTRFDANWALRGIKFGKADRAMVSEALKSVVERMQREFTLAEG